MKNFWKKHWKLFIYILMIALIFVLIWFAFGDTIPEYFELLHDGNETEIENYIARESSWKGMLTTIVLAALQVVSIVFPGFAIQIASGVIYGWFRSFLLCYSGFLLGNMAVFLFARKMGGQIAGFGPTKKNRSTGWIREKLKTTRPEFIVGFVNLLPILPNGIIPYIAAGSSITTFGYFVSIGVTCWIQILFNCLAGGFLKHGQYLFMVIALGIQVAVLAIVTWKRKAIMSLIPGGDPHMDTDEPDTHSSSDSGSESSSQTDSPAETQDIKTHKRNT